MRFSLFSGILISTILILNSCDRKHASIPDQAADSVKFLAFRDTAAIDPSWSDENKVIFHILFDPDNLHPTNGMNVSRRQIFHLTQKTLIGIDLENLTIRPDLLQTLPQPADDHHFQCRLRGNIRWDDGSPLTNADVLFTFKANRCTFTNNPHSRQSFASVQDVIADPKDPLAFTLVTRTSRLEDLAFLIDIPVMQHTFHDPENILSGYSYQEVGEVPASTAARLKQWADQFNAARYAFDMSYLNGLGPYKVKSWENGQQLILERKKDHWTTQAVQESAYPIQIPYEEAFPEQIVFMINRDPNSIFMAFKSQEYDASLSLSVSLLTKLINDSTFRRNYNYGFTDNFSHSYMAFNMKPDGIKHQKILTDKLTRRAVALLTPVEKISELLSQGRNKRIAGPIYPETEAFNPDSRLLPYDPEKAKDLLQEAGWKDSDNNGILERRAGNEIVPFIIELSYMNTQPEWKDLALIVSESLKKAGIRANLRPLDPNAFYEKAAIHDFDILIGTWIDNFLHPDFAQLWHTSSWSSNGSNYTGFGNADTDALIDSINTATGKDQVMLSRKFQQILYEEHPYVFLLRGLNRIAAHKRFANAELFKELPGTRINRWKLRTVGKKSK